MPCKLRGDLGLPGDFGGYNPRSDRSERWECVDPSVNVLGWDDCTESILLVKLGSKGDGASTFSLGSTGSGEEARGALTPK